MKTVVKVGVALVLGMGASLLAPHSAQAKDPCDGDGCSFPSDCDFVDNDTISNQGFAQFIVCLDCTNDCKDNPTSWTKTVYARHITYKPIAKKAPTYCNDVTLTGGIDACRR